ncbi:Cadherin tumor suppressor [Schistosoma japonicum]|nr:Cadherin tumor suppressor [Schistosoma japonicum]
MAVNRYKITILQITVLFSILMTKGTANKSLSISNEFLFSWILKESHFKNIMYGFPVNIIGGLVPTVKLQFIHCTPENALNWSMIDCQALYIPSYCHFAYEQIDLLKNTSSQSIKCNQYIESRMTSNRWIKEAYKKSTRIVKIDVNDTTTDNIRQYFMKCGQELQYFINNNSSLMPLCDWDNYVKLFSNDDSFSIYKQPNIISYFSAIYTYYFCTIAWPEQQKKTGVKLRHILCPNPCSYGIAKCSGKQHVRKSISQTNKLVFASMTNCITTGLGVFEQDYKCLCEAGYSWNSDTESCEIDDPCIVDQILTGGKQGIKDKDKLCDPKGTLRCIYTLHRDASHKDIYYHQSMLGLHYSCICHPKYMGYRCDRLKNPCIENSLPNRIPGNEACRIYLGNKCNPINGTNYYTCSCVGNYKHSSKYSFYNCYESKNICDSIICRNKGTCISSEDGKHFLCSCEYGWHGKYCEYPDIRQWLPWNPWSICSAQMCGGHGWQSRNRECRIGVNETSGFGKCLGNTIEVRPCSAEYPDFAKTYIPLIKTFLLFTCSLISLYLSVSIIRLLIRSELV